MHEVLVNRLGGLSLPRKSVVRLTDRPDMTLDVYRGRKTTMQQQQNVLIWSTAMCCSSYDEPKYMFDFMKDEEKLLQELSKVSFFLFFFIHIRSSNCDNLWIIFLTFP